MIKRLQPDGLQYIGSNQLNLLQDSPKSNQSFARLAIGSDTVIQLHDMARSLQPKEALQLRAIADNLASLLKRL
jgi:hypothetical protein